MTNEMMINGEMLTDEQLDNVNGGNTEEFLEISHLLGIHFG